MNHNHTTGPVVRWGDTGAFGIVPEWIIEGEISHLAVRVYALLARHAGMPGEDTFRGKNEMAERLHCSRSSVTNAIRELVAVRAIEIEERHYSNGGQAENNYVVFANPDRVQQAAPPPPQTDTPTRAILPGEPTKAEPIPREVMLKRRIVVDRKPATADEMVLATMILQMWNLATGQKLIAVDWLRKIIMRIREHPELTIDDHNDVIGRVLADPHPWWRGPASPSIIYGNGAQFERSLAVGPGMASSAPRRYGRGMTTAEMRAATREENP